MPGSAGHLLLFHLGQRLAVDAHFGRGAGFQTADADLDAAGLAVAEVVFLELQQRFLDLLIKTVYRLG